MATVDLPPISAALRDYRCAIVHTARGMGSTMTKVTAGTAKKTEKSTGFASDGTALDCRYGQIGISAVAAAVRYQGEAKNQAYAPVAIRFDYDVENAA
jgi:hypothetical protein